MSELWNRSARLEFGVRGRTGVVIDTKAVKAPHTVPEIEFDISKGIKSKNKANIRIYNLNKTSRESLTNTEKDTLFCDFQLGFNNDNFVVFRGDIQTAGSHWDGRNWVTTMEAFDGLSLDKTKFNKSYAPKTDYKTILEDVIKNVKGEFKSVISGVKTEVTQNGITLSGISSAVINKIVNSLPNQNLEYTVQDEVIYIKNATSMIDEGNIQVLRYDTGLIGVPKRTKEGVEFQAIIRKGLFPQRGVEIQTHSGELDGVYILQKVKLKGSLRGKDWTATCEGKLTDKYQIVEVP